MAQTKVEKEIALGQYLSIVNLVQGLIEHAYENNASDLHINPVESSIRVRMRVDGMLQDIYSLPKTIIQEIISRIKVMAALRTDEHQVPQDGRFRVALSDTSFVDVRVSIVPTYYGENAVLRILVQNKTKLSLQSLGFSAKNAQKMHATIKRSHGMILTTGPTGSGKTTTLYSLVEHINNPRISIVTIEDPIEYSLQHVEQVQVNPKSGLTFASGLRALLRQDPDVIMVGEIRDSETASIAVNSALTGHLVVSTLHTSDAASSFPRLLDMKIDPYLIASTVSVVIAQRLVRTICTRCKASKRLTEEEKLSLTSFGSIPSEINSVCYGKGCDECKFSGYKGRTGIHEVIEVNDEIKDLLIKKSSSREIKEASVRYGTTTLLEDGFLKVSQGITTIEEVLRVFHE